MNTKIKTLGLLLIGSITLLNCSKEDTPETNVIKKPSSEQFNAVRKAAMKKVTQNFTMTAGKGLVTLTSAKGVTIKIDGNCLTKNGNPVTGTVNIEYIELFDKGHMLTTNKPTMGVMPDGKKNLLISGGEFFIKATQSGVELGTTCALNLIVPANLTDPADAVGMTAWTGDTKDAENLAWREDRKGGVDAGGQGAGGTNYYVTFGNFGWTNVDKFYSDPRPKTTILVDAPDGYDNTNSAVYLSYDGEGLNQLAKMDTYTTAGLFSEHYGQIPVGLACHIIFATEENGQWRYAIKGVTTTANAVYTFTQAETVLGTEAQLVAAINAIQ
jgi:hypothetical protein